MSEKNKKKITVSIITVLLVVFTIGITYAFVSQVLTGEKQVVINAGVLDLVLEEENAITISDALPMYDAVGMIQEDVFVFRLVNKTSNPTNYILKLSKINADNELSLSDVKYYLTKEGVGEPKLLSSLSTDGTVDSGTIAGGDTIDYTLRLWIDSGVTDNSAISGKSLSYRIDVEISQNTLPVIYQLNLADKVQESTSTFPNFGQISSETNGRGIYKYQEDGEDIYYWRGNINAVATEENGIGNHIIFGGYCWEMVRTTKTGGVKMIYDGVPVEIDGVKTCPNTDTASQLTTRSAYNSNRNSLAYIGYMYGNTVYEFQTKTSSDVALTTPGILYGYDVEWTGTEYELKAKEEGSLYSSTGSWDTDRNGVGYGNHYTCFDDDGKCETVSYVYYTGEASATPYYIDLRNGKKLEDALDQMYANDQPSTIKTTIENWFESTDLDEEENLSKLEDVVYCNDRSVPDGDYAGWSKDGNALMFMSYSAQARRGSGKPDLSCNGAENNRDRFTYKDTINGNGLLKWPVGMLTSDEMVLSGGQNVINNTDYYLYTGQTYWILSPAFMRYDYPSVMNVPATGILYNGGVFYEDPVRPVITLSSDVKITGLGTESTPYVVE